MRTSNLAITRLPIVLRGIDHNPHISVLGLTSLSFMTISMDLSSVLRNRENRSAVTNKL